MRKFYYFWRQRFHMMINGKKSPKMRLAAYSLALPLALLFLAVDNVGAVAERPNLTTVAQTKKEISGVILDKVTKKTMSRVTILVKGSTTNGTISDKSGHFKLTVNETDTVCFSFVGYSCGQFPAQKLLENPITVEMERSVVRMSTMAAVTVVAYVKQEKTSQQPESASELTAPCPASQTQEQDEKGVLIVLAEEMPAYPGGESALKKFITDNLTYPPIAAENGIEGEVVCKFFIREDGSVDNVHVDYPVHPALEKEAIRVINKMPKWQPGAQRGKPVPVEYAIPIEFRLQKSK